MNDHTFTVGERVAVIGPYGEGIREIALIDRVTPSGQIVIGKSKYRPDGREITTSSSWSRDRIVPLTPELTRDLFRRRATTRVRSISEREANSLTDDDLRAIVAILDRAKNQEK